MFSERHLRGQTNKNGWIEVITGCMFSCKTEELIRRLNRMLIACQKVEIFKPAIDIRYDDKKVVSHDQRVIRSTPVNLAREIPPLASKCNIIGIDETQFFSEELVDVSVELANAGKRVILAGLDMDYQGRPFGPMPELMAIAEYVTKLQAVCMVCGSTATHTFRLTPGDDKVLLGEKGDYEARCRACFRKGMDGQ